MKGRKKMARRVASDWMDVYRQEKRRPAYVLENGRTIQTLYQGEIFYPDSSRLKK